MVAAAIDDEGDDLISQGLSFCKLATDLRQSSDNLLAPSLSESSFSDSEDRSLSSNYNNGKKYQSNGNKNNNFSLHKIANSTAFKRRLSRQSSLSWGHRPSPLVGASCFLFLLPIPLLIRACCPVSACFLGCITATSYLSDHVFTGLESWAHAVDRAVAPVAFGSCFYSIFSTCGPLWAFSSLAAIKCHVLANYHSKSGNYHQFVIWHSLWHAVGVGLILICFAFNRDHVPTCWEGISWDYDLYLSHEHFMSCVLVGLWIVSVGLCSVR